VLKKQEKGADAALPDAACMTPPSLGYQTSLRRGVAPLDNWFMKENNSGQVLRSGDHATNPEVLRTPAIHLRKDGGGKIDG
jgi:hypothetical protein